MKEKFWEMVLSPIRSEGFTYTKTALVPTKKLKCALIYFLYIIEQHFKTIYLILCQKFEKLLFIMYVLCDTSKYILVGGASSNNMLMRHLDHAT